MTTLEQLVTDLATSQRLRDAGFPQDTAMYWQRSTMHIDHPVSVHVRGDNEIAGIEDFFEDICAAPTAEEILMELPWTLQPWPPTIESAFLHVVKEPDGFRVAWYTWNNKQEAPCDGKDKHYEKESEAAAQAYLWWKKEVAG